MASMKSIVLLALSCVVPTLARAGMKQVELVDSVVLSRSGWAAARTPETQEKITLQIGLTLQNTDTLINKLLDISNPSSQNYGKWLDRDSTNAIVQPNAQSNQAVIDWLKRAGIDRLSSDGTWVTFEATVQQANELLDANFLHYEKDGVRKVRTNQYSVPAKVAQHIDLIHPTTFFGKTEAFRPVHLPTRPENSNKVLVTRNQGSPAQVDPSCRIGVTPLCLKQFYNVGNYTPSATSGSLIGFSSFLNESAQYEDLRIYQQSFNIPFQNLTKIFVNQAANSQDPNSAQETAGEANLDAQNIVGVGNPLPVVEFLTGGSPPFVPDLEEPTPADNTNEPYLPYYQFLLSKSNAELPQVISNSYGEPEQTVPQKYAERVCTMISMMGARGITVFESSGDTGIGSHCRSNDGTNRLRFLPQFPGTCPWVTAVGGTESASPEIAWRDSSGGFSDYFSRPNYQDKALESYFSDNFPKATQQYYAPYYNRSGRGFPDISAHSLLPNYQIVYGGRIGSSGGTSAASPVWAALVGLLNDARFRSNPPLPPLGFINTWLYNRTDVLVDITKGAARGCDGTNHQSGKNVTGAGIIPGAFWNATTGWDPATGLGIPDFQKMLAAALELK